MLTQPTTELLLRGIARDLNEQIAPELQSESAKVALGMIVQLLNGCVTRAAHEGCGQSDGSRGDSTLASCIAAGVGKYHSATEAAETVRGPLATRRAFRRR